MDGEAMFRPKWTTATIWDVSLVFWGKKMGY